MPPLLVGPLWPTQSFLLCPSLNLDGTDSRYYSLLYFSFSSQLEFYIPVGKLNFIPCPHCGA